jgi:hypothetical protein
MKTILSLLAVICAIVLWIASLRSGIDLGRMTDLGLISVLPPTFYVALGILTVSFCVAVHRSATPMPLLILHVVVLILIIHATPTILYGTLRYAWAWRHIGIVDYIQRHGSVNPNISVENVYQNWPGFFALGALLTEAAGFKSALSFAAWGPPFFNLLDLGGLLLIFKSFTEDRRLVWLSVWFFYLANMVGQDYFSPQAMSYFLNLVILGICLRWFRVTTIPPLSVLRRWLVFYRCASLFHRLLRDAARADALEPRLKPFKRAALLTMIVLFFAVSVSSHQLTPFMTILEVTGLVVFQRCRVRNLPLLMVVMTVAWIVNMAIVFLKGNLYWIVQSIGNPTTNANPALVDVQKASAGLQQIILMGRVLVAAVICLAFLGFIRRCYLGYRDVSCVLLAIAPVPMLAANSYGGEMLFRVYFFALPFMAFFSASLLYPHKETGRTWRTLALATAISAGLLVCFFFPYYGKERLNYFSPNEVTASQFLYTDAPVGSLLLSMDGNYPFSFKNYEHFTYYSLIFDPASGNEISRQQRKALLGNPADFIYRVMEATPHTAAYLIFTQSQEATLDENGYLPPGSQEAIERALKHSGRFRVILKNPDAAIYILSVK